MNLGRFFKNTIVLSVNTMLQLSVHHISLLSYNSGISETGNLCAKSRHNLRFYQQRKMLHSISYADHGVE